MSLIIRIRVNPAPGLKSLYWLSHQPDNLEPEVNTCPMIGRSVQYGELVTVMVPHCNL